MNPEAQKKFVDAGIECVATALVRMGAQEPRVEAYGSTARNTSLDTGLVDADIVSWPVPEVEFDPFKFCIHVRDEISGYFEEFRKGTILIDNTREDRVHIKIKDRETRLMLDINVAVELPSRALRGWVLHRKLEEHYASMPPAIRSRVRQLVKWIKANLNVQKDAIFKSVNCEWVVVMLARCPNGGWQTPTVELLFNKIREISELNVDAARIMPEAQSFALPRGITGVEEAVEDGLIPNDIHPVRNLLDRLNQDQWSQLKTIAREAG